MLILPRGTCLRQNRYLKGMQGEYVGRGPRLREKRGREKEGKRNNELRTGTGNKLKLIYFIFGLTNQV